VKRRFPAWQTAVDRGLCVATAGHAGGSGIPWDYIPRRECRVRPRGCEMRRLKFLNVVGLTWALAACTTAVAPSATPTWPPVRVSNQTSVPVTLVVNGATITVIPAGGVVDPVLSPLPDRPWAMQLQSPSGRPLVTLDVPAGNITVGLNGGPGILACGFIYLAVAGPLPNGGPAFTALPGATPCD